jgi:hypothetical protein
MADNVRRAEGELARHLRAWLCHAALNAGEAVNRLELCARSLCVAVVCVGWAGREAGLCLLALVYAVLPPQAHHAPETVERLSRRSVRRSFRQGLN